MKSALVLLVSAVSLLFSNSVGVINASDSNKYYIVDSNKNVYLTEQGIQEMDKFIVIEDGKFVFNSSMDKELYDETLISYVDALLLQKNQELMHVDQNYEVEDNEFVFTISDLELSKYFGDTIKTRAYGTTKVVNRWYGQDIYLSAYYTKKFYNYSSYSDILWVASGALPVPFNTIVAGYVIGYKTWVNSSSQNGKHGIIIRHSPVTGAAVWISRQ